jgi:multidrug efflux pump subunit AcrA (membrane-fusion protein)
VKTATARLAAAKQQLDETIISAPFSSFVTERFVSPGQTVNVGDRLLKLVDDRVFELTLELGRNDWVMLRQPLAGQVAQVQDQGGKVIAEATIRRGGGFLNEKTRQYKIFLEIAQKDKGSVLSGDFVRVVLPGITVPAALNIPESALTQQGYVWYLNDEDRLHRLTPRVLFHRQGRVVIEAPQREGTWRFATTPLASFLPGLKVQPTSVER